MGDLDPFLRTANEFGCLGPIEDLPEFALLIGRDVAATPGAAVETDPGVEGRRTAMSTDCFEEACSGDMSKFSLLLDEQREHLQAEMIALAADPDAYDAVRFGLVVHDMFKSDRALAVVGLPKGFDHDEAYHLVMTDPAYEVARRQLMPSMDLLTPRAQDLLMRTSNIVSNYPQTLQGEAPAAALEDLHNEPDSLVRDIDIVIKQFDIFGALGHVNQETSLTATPGTYRAMQNLNTALRDPSLPSAQACNDAFLDAELTHFMGPLDKYTAEQRVTLRTIARLERHLRVEEPEVFVQLMEDFGAQAPVVQEILLTELTRTHRATLANYSPDLFRTVTKLAGGQFALTYLAHVLQEAHIADQKARREGRDGIFSVQLDELMRAMYRGEFHPRQSTVRFVPYESGLVAEPYGSKLESVADLPEFDGERLRGKRIVLVGEGGGSDGLQAVVVGNLFAAKYGCRVEAVVSVRNEERVVEHGGRRIGQAIQEITPETRPVGNWRYLEGIATEGDPSAPMYILNSTDPTVIKGDIRALLQETAAEMVIGVDTGGDSLYRNLHPGFSAHLPTDITPDQDYTVIRSLAEMATERPEVGWLSVIVAPGVDSPDYAKTVLQEAGAARVPLDGHDVTSVQAQYAAWRMDGSGSDEGRYGKTPLAWLHALRGNNGFQLLELPRANVLSDANPWRAFTVITPAMAEVVVASMVRHYVAIRRG